MTKRVVIVIPDAGPLISLAKGDALDVLLSLGLPIWIVDQVYFEATRDEAKEDAARIKTFVSGHSDHMHVFETRVGRLAEIERSQDPTAKQRGFGEAAIAEFYARLDEVIDPTDPILIVFEDSDVRRINALVQGNVHLLSTRAFLIGLQARGKIPSADAVWQAINKAGRTPSEKEIDLPAPEAYGGSRW